MEWCEIMNTIHVKVRKEGRTTDSKVIILEGKEPSSIIREFSEILTVNGLNSKKEEIKTN